METLEIINQINSLKAEFYDFVFKWSCDYSHTYFSSDNIVIFGPFTRSSAYQQRGTFKVFKFHDLFDKYYLVKIDSPNGPFVYRRLVSFRSLLRRLEKELKK